MSPLRSVVDARERGNSNTIFKAGIGKRWWVLTLECGHREERPLRNRPGAAQGRRGYALQYNPTPKGHELPPPKRVRCHECFRLGAA